MTKIGLFYGSNTGHTEEVAGKLSEYLREAGYDVEMHNVAGTNINKMMKYDMLIMAASTWKDGELPEDWKAAYNEYANLDFSGKRVAFVGLGDQANYPQNFADAVGKLARPVDTNGGRIFGQWPTDGYDFESSHAVKGDHFYGLILDDDNEDDLTDERIREWTALLSRQLQGREYADDSEMLDDEVESAGTDDMNNEDTENFEGDEE
ncbi:MAG: flavodoxin [Candidatus Zixiibacteriota bacterium]